jgi:hypothetical protein
MKRAVWLAMACCGMLAAADLKVPMFFARQDFPSAGYYVAVGDVNGDGIPDIVAFDNAYLSVMFGKGGGLFGAAKNTTLDWEFGDGLAVADLNSDGNADAVISGSFRYPNGIAVCLSNGDGTFQVPVFYPAGSDDGVGNPVIADFNGDGILDVMLGGASGIWFFQGKGGGTFGAGVLAVPLPGAASIAAADFNGDGNLDLAVGSSSGLSVLFGNGNGTFQPPVQVPNGNGHCPFMSCIVAGDVNGDGYPDIVVGNGSMYMNNGHGAFPTSQPTPVSGEQAVVGDVNGDGIPDLASSDGTVALGLGGGQFAPQVGYPIACENVGSFGVAMAYLSKKDKSGYEDIIVGVDGAVSLLLNENNANFVEAEWVSVPGSGNCAASGDFNGDGKPDLAIPTSNGLVILLGTGNASAPYRVGTTIPLSGPGCPISGDLTGNGKIDLLEGANSLGGVGVYMGNGKGEFELASVVPLSPANDMVLGDFNHDGVMDIATSANQLAYGKGKGEFESPVAIWDDPPPLGFNWIEAGDFNNDGWIDLMAIEGGCLGEYYVMLNNHKGGFTVTTTNTNNYPCTGMLGDFNGDGNLDAVLQYGDTVGVYLGNGKGEFTPTSHTISYPFVDQLPPQVGDVNGDGILDILLPADGMITIALGEGDGTFVTPLTVGAGSNEGQILLQNLHGQSAKSGLPDIVEPDSGGGVTVLINLTK